VAAPAPSAPPVPYWPTVVIKPDTVQGVGTLFVNLILDIIFSICALAVGLSAVFVAASSDPVAAAGFIATLGAASCGLVLVFVINFIISLMSVLRMHHGADEYGPEHAANARRGVTFKWIGAGLSTMAAIMVVGLVIFGSTAFFLAGGVPPTVYVPLLITVFWTAGVSAKAQMYRFMVRALQPPETRRWSDIASAIIPALGIVGISLVGYYTVRVLDLFSNSGLVTSQEAAQLTQVMVGGVFLPPGLALVGYIVFLAVYGRTRDRLSRGLSTLYGSLPQPAAWTAPSSLVANPRATLPSIAPSAGDGFCGRCGHPYAAGAQFCLNCGTRLFPSTSGPS
jgi:zinc ribbon protein